MKSKQSLALISILTLIGFVAGCQDRQAALKTANDSFATVMENLTAARRAGSVSDEQQRRIAKLRDQTSAALDAAGVFLRAGDAASFDAAIDSIHDSLRDLILENAKVKHE